MVIFLLNFQAHVCVQQTVIDLLERNIEVHVIADACSSRSQMDRKFAYKVRHYKYNFRGRSRISEKGVHLYKGVGGLLCYYYLIFLKYHMKMK